MQLSNTAAAGKDGDLPRTVLLSLGPYAQGATFLPTYLEQREISLPIIPPTLLLEEEEERRVLERTIVAPFWGSSSSSMTIQQQDDSCTLENKPVADASRLPRQKTRRTAACWESLDDLVDRVVTILVQRREASQSQQKLMQMQMPLLLHNVLCQGYVVASEGRGSHGGRGVQCTLINSSVLFLKQSAAFRRLHATLGDDAFVELLLSTHLLVPVGNTSNYRQICGPPLPHYPTNNNNNNTKPSTTESNSGMTGMKRQHSLLQKGDPTMVRPKESSCGHDMRVWNANENLPRRQLFYNETFVPHVGLPQSHPLHSKAPDADRHIWKNMLQMDYNTNSDNQTCTLRKKNKKKRRNERFANGGLRMCAEVRRNHNHKCDYARLLERHCPLPIHRHAGRKRRRNKITTHIMDTSEPLRASTCSPGPEDECCPMNSGTSDDLESIETTESKNLGTSDDLESMETTESNNETCLVDDSKKNSSKASEEINKKGTHDDTGDDVVHPDMNKDPSLSELAASYCSGHEVTCFLHAVIKKLFPFEFWGSNHNWKIALETCKTFVLLRRREEFPRKATLRGIRVNDMSWLFPTKGNRKCRTIHETATRLVQNVMWWFYCDVIIPLLRCNFYVTESEFSANRVLYYRKPVWSQYRALSLKSLTTQRGDGEPRQYTKLKFKEALNRLSHQTMGCARLRLLPKKTGVRPISLLSKRAKIGGTFQNQNNLKQPALPMRDAQKNWFSSIRRSLSTNQILTPTFEVLSYEHDRCPSDFGYGVYGFNEIFPLLCNFVRDFHKDKGKITNGSAQRKLYFASVDIHHCYDNIDQDYLFKTVKELFSQKDYLIQKHSVIHPYNSMERVQRKVLKSISLPENYKTFESIAEQLAKRYNDSIFVDGVKCSVSKKEDMFELIREHLFSNLLIVNESARHDGPTVLLQASGIPQGSILSTLLCNGYYGNIEKELLKDVFEPPSEPNEFHEHEHCHLLVRIVDDYLLITSDHGTSLRFVEKMNKGIPKLGIKINDDKTRVNYNLPDYFELSGGTANNTHCDGPYFSWCGLLIDVDTCEVRLDYSRFANTKALDAMTIDRSGNEGKQFGLRIKSFIRPRCMPIMYDERINSIETMHTNFYQAILLCAIKTRHYITSGLVDGCRRNPSFIASSIMNLISYAYTLIVSRVKNASLQGNGKVCVGQKEHPFKRHTALWLGYHGFEYVFQSSQIDFEEVLAVMKKQVTTTIRLHKAEIVRLERVAKSALNDFDFKRFTC
eukprot:scaffold71588_cov47-Attheya_sp.AAC.2